MAENGSFGEAFRANVKELLYVTLSGRSQAGDERMILDKPEELRMAVDQVAILLPQLLKKFADPETPFLASPHPERGNKYDDYAGISRRVEWEGEGDDVSG